MSVKRSVYRPKRANRKANKSRRFDFGADYQDGMSWNNYSGVQLVPKVHRGDQKYTYIKAVDLGNVLTTSTTVPIGASLNFTLNQLPEVSSLTTLFDQYKIEEICVDIVAEGNTNNNSLDSRWASVLDYDDSATLTTFAQALEYDTALITPLNNGHARRFKPHVAVAAYSGAFTSFANQPAQWLDCGSPNIQHYGIKLIAEPSVTATGVSAVAWLKVSFRASR